MLCNICMDLIVMYIYMHGYFPVRGSYVEVKQVEPGCGD